MEFAKCINCNSENVECSGYDENYKLDEYFCYNCNEYFLLDWDKIDANNVVDDNEYPVGYMEEDGEFDEDFNNEEDYL